MALSVGPGVRGPMGFRSVGPLCPSLWLPPAGERTVGTPPLPPSCGARVQSSFKALTSPVHLLGARPRKPPQWGTHLYILRAEKQVTNRSFQRMTILREMKVQEGHVMVTCEGGGGRAPEDMTLELRPQG